MAVGVTAGRAHVRTTQLQIYEGRMKTIQCGGAVTHYITSHRILSYQLNSDHMI